MAGLIILAHAVVPHHHHFEFAHSSGQESTCESSGNETPDSHCYAFNILVSGKTSNSSLNFSLAEYFSFYLPGIIANIETPSFRELIPAYFGYRATFLKQFFVTAQSLRAPPATA